MSEALGRNRDVKGVPSLPRGRAERNAANTGATPTHELTKLTEASLAPAKDLGATHADIRINRNRDPAVSLLSRPTLTGQIPHVPAVNVLAHVEMLSHLLRAEGAVVPGIKTHDFNVASILDAGERPPKPASGCGDSPGQTP